MTFVRTICVAFFLCLISLGFASAQDVGVAFTDVQKLDLSTLIDKEMAISAKYSAINQGYEIAFKVGLFVVGVLVAIGTAVAALKDTTPPRWLTVGNAVLASLATLASALAFTQFDFPKRHAIWEKRYQSLQACRISLAFPQADHAAFRRQLEKITSWSDSSSLTDLTASCNAEDKAPSAAQKPTQAPQAPQAPVPGSAASRP